MGRSRLEVADVFRRYGEAFRQRYGASLSGAQRRVMTAIELCRTAALGGHVEKCNHCDHQRNSYNSCLMGKFRNGELTIASAAKLTVFPVILSRSIHVLLSITTVDGQDPRKREIVQLTTQHLLKASPRIDARNLAAVESACAIVVDENLDEVEVNAPPRLREGPFDPRHALGGSLGGHS